jgi:hypothetical protein
MRFFVELLFLHTHDGIGIGGRHGPAHIFQARFGAGRNLRKRIIAHDAVVAPAGEIAPMILVVFILGDLFGALIDITEHPQRIVILAVQWVTIGDFHQARS